MGLVLSRVQEALLHANERVHPVACHISHSAGGDGKGQDFTPLAAAVAGRAREVVLIGRDAPAVATALAGSGAKLSRASGMNEAVLMARAAARPGDAVLLSPACASLDMFRNYGHRGDVFVAAVRALKGAG